MTARRILANLVALVRRDKVERDLDDELKAYLAASAEDLTRRGMPRDDAVRAFEHCDNVIFEGFDPTNLRPGK